MFTIQTSTSELVSGSKQTILANRPLVSILRGCLGNRLAQM